MYPRAFFLSWSLLTGFSSPQPPRWELHASPFYKGRASTWVPVTSALADVTLIKGSHTHTTVVVSSGWYRRIGLPANTTGGLALQRLSLSPGAKTRQG